MDRRELAPDNTDARVRLYKSITSFVPAGSFITNYLIDRIPNQRLDRLVRYVESLEDRISKLEYEIDPEDDNFVDLFEDGALQSARSMSDTRAQYIANAVVPRNTLSQREWELRKKILTTLRDVSDLDIRILEAHLDLVSRLDIEEEIFRPETVSYADRQNMSDKELFSRELESESWDSHLTTLFQQGLLEKNYAQVFERSLDRDDNQVPDPEEDITVTRYGRLFLGAISTHYPRQA